MCASRVIVQPHWFFMARGVQVWTSAPNRMVKNLKCIEKAWFPVS